MAWAWVHNLFGDALLYSFLWNNRSWTSKLSFRKFLDFLQLLAETVRSRVDGFLPSLTLLTQHAVRRDKRVTRVPDVYVLSRFSNSGCSVRTSGYFVPRRPRVPPPLYVVTPLTSGSARTLFFLRMSGRSKTWRSCTSVARGWPGDTGRSSSYWNAFLDTVRVFEYVLILLGMWVTFCYSHEFRLILDGIPMVSSFPPTFRASLLCGVSSFPRVAMTRVDVAFRSCLLQGSPAAVRVLLGVLGH